MNDPSGEAKGPDSREPEDSAPTIEVPVPKGGLPRKIGHYTIQGVIASGGMGTVYKAVQEQPRRVVAIKVMKRGVASKGALRRFEYEAQLLGRLRHSGIAQVYEAGTHDDGSESVPYFAMEYIPNAKSITEYAKEKGLGTRERLELFVKVCDAVHHGHQKGIVHRDLKPSNLLVGPNGNPRVIDFGVARATDSDMALTTIQTDVGQLVGTVQYMSPEQCEADPHDIDTRSDVYALGVVLYELLCEQLPYDIGSTPIFEATRLIREQNPARPSSANSRLRGDVETVVLKALEKDRDRRYQSAAEFGQDLKRYLVGEAITARPASISYQFRVFARRKKGLLAALSTIFVVVLAGAILSTALYFKAEASRAKAEDQRQKALTTITYLQDVFESMDPLKVGQDVRLSDLLDTYSKKIGEKFPDQPEVEAMIRTELAQQYINLNLFEKAGKSEKFLRAAEDHLSKALEIRTRVLGPEHPDTIASLEFQAFFQMRNRDLAQAEQLRREAFSIRERVQGLDHPDTQSIGYDLAGLLLNRGKTDEAEALTVRLLEHRRDLYGHEDSRTLNSLSQLAWVYQKQEKFSEAENVKEQVFETFARTMGPDDDATISARNSLAHLYVTQGRFEDASRLYDDKKQPDDWGIDHWFRGETEFDSATPRVCVFFEVWCPYTQQAAPELQSLHSRYNGAKFELVGLTEVTYSSTNEKVLEFIEGNGLEFPIAKMGGDSLKQFKPWGYPHALVMKDGKLVWRGHPDGITDGFMQGLVASDRTSRSAQ